MCEMPSTVVSAPVSQRWAGGGRRVSRCPAHEADRAEAAFLQRRRTFPESRDVLLPGGDRIRLVESRGGDGLPEALHVGLAEHGSGPALVWIAEDRPLDEALVLGV